MHSRAIARPALLFLLPLVHCGAPASATDGSSCPEFAVEVVFAPSCGPFDSANVVGYGINDFGDVVGRKHTCFSDTYEAIYWPTCSASYELIPMPPGTTNSEALRIDNHGNIMGVFSNPSTGAVEMAFVIEGGPRGRFTAIPPPRGANLTRGTALGAGATAGQVLGWWAHSALGGSGPFLWDDGNFIDLQPNFATSTEALGMNGLGRIVGWTGQGGVTASGTSAFVFERGVVHLLGAVPGGINSVATDINDAGAVTGYGFVPVEGQLPGKRRAFVWSEGAMRLLGVLPGSNESRAEAINAQGWIVGSSQSKPFLWRYGAMRNVNEMLNLPAESYLTTVIDLSDTGWMVSRIQVGSQSGAVRVRPLRNAADLDCDGVVAASDLGMLLEAWGPVGKAGADLTGNGIVDAADLAALLGEWTFPAQ